MGVLIYTQTAYIGTQTALFISRKKPLREKGLSHT
jgi:hypothetical protein